LGPAQEGLVVNTGWWTKNGSRSNKTRRLSAKCDHFYNVLTYFHEFVVKTRIKDNFTQEVRNGISDNKKLKVF
jgi:hypothetical protein